MNKKIKVIELYERLAKQENMPGKIKYYNDIYYLCIDALENVFYYETNKGFQLMIYINSVQALNREVEILEDEEEIEEIKVDDNNYIVTDNGTNLKGRAIDITFVNKINEIIKKVNELDKKINKEDKLMNIYQRFDKYFQYSYFNETNEKVGVFSKDTPEDILREAKNIFDVIEYD